MAGPHTSKTNLSHQGATVKAAAYRCRDRCKRGTPPRTRSQRPAPSAGFRPERRTRSPKSPARPAARTNQGIDEDVIAAGQDQPGIRRLRIGLPARQWRPRDDCGLSRLNDLLALWSQAHMPSCNLQVTSTSIHMAKPGSTSPLAVTHRHNRTHRLWLEQFQIADYERPVTATQCRLSRAQNIRS